MQIHKIFKTELETTMKLKLWNISNFSFYQINMEKATTKPIIPTTNIFGVDQKKLYF